MGTGAVYVALSGIKNHSKTLTGVETFFYFLAIALFLLNNSTLAIQAILYPRQSLRLIQDPVKGVFVPLVVLSFATIIIGTINYAVPTHVHPEFVYALFWVYVVFALVVCFPMLMIWFNKPHDLSTFTPAWAFLVFPMMLVGVVAFNVLKVMDKANDPRAVGVLLCGYFFQGLGFFMTFFYICIYVIRVMTTGFLDGHQANGAFVACGPPGFTALALLNLGQHARVILPAHGLVTQNAGEIWYAVSVMSALMLYGLAVFFFFFGALPYWFKVHKHLNEILGCWALTFPNVGWINTTRALGDVFEIQGFFTLHLILVCIVCVIWVILMVLTAWAFWRGEIFFAKNEDVLADLDLMPKTEDNDRPRESFDSRDVDLEKAIAPGHGHH